MSDEVDEKLERWVPIDGIDDAFLTAELWYEHPTLAVRPESIPEVCGA